MHDTIFTNVRNSPLVIPSGSGVNARAAPAPVYGAAGHTRPKRGLLEARK